MCTKSAINMLQEYFAKSNQPLPNYSIESIGNAHSPKFLCKLTTVSVTSESISVNKKDAKQKAAEIALLKLGFKQEILNQNKSRNISTNIFDTSTTSVLPKDFIGRKNYTGLLNEYAAGIGSSYPSYKEPLFAINGLFQVNCEFNNLITVGHATNKKEAKQVASYRMLKKLNVSEHSSNHFVEKPRTTKQQPVLYTEVDMEVLRKIQHLSFASNSKRKEQDIFLEPNPHIKGMCQSIEEAENELSKFHEKYEIKELQKSPPVIIVSLDKKDLTIMRTGSTTEDACINALNDAIRVLQEGCYHIPLEN